MRRRELISRCGIKLWGVKRIVSIGLALALSSTIVASGEFYKNAAHCLGGLQSRIEIIDRDIKASEANEDVLNTIRDLKMKIFVIETIVKHAIERGEIDEVTAARMKLSGHNEQDACDRGLNKCIDESRVRNNEKVGAEQGNEQSRRCTGEVMKQCEKLKKACEE